MTTATEPKLNGTTVPEETMTDLQKLLVKYGTEMAGEFAEIAPLWGTDPAKAAEMQMGITQRIHEKASIELADQDKAKKEQETNRASAVEAFRATATLTFNTLWKELAPQASKLGHVKMWTFQVQVDPDKDPKADGSVYFSDPTIMASLPKQVGTRTGTHTRTPNPTARQPIQVKLKGSNEFTEYKTAAAAKVEILKVEKPMNKADVIAELVKLGHEVKA